MTTTFDPFTAEQVYLISEGKIKTDQLKEVVEIALGVIVPKVKNKRHTYIQSPPGAGKTLTVLTTADTHKIHLHQIRGHQTMSDLALKIATIVYKANGKHSYIWIDDCDSPFSDPKSINVMKNAMDREINKFSWSANWSRMRESYLNSDNPNDVVKGEAITRYQAADGNGVDVPTDNVTFIITSNDELVSQGEVELIRAGKIKGKRFTKMMNHQPALQDRLIYKPISLTPKQSWGWVAYIVMNNDILGLDESQKHRLLNWMMANWHNLRSTSMRAVVEMGEEMINHPTDYTDYWKTYLIKEE